MGCASSTNKAALEHSLTESNAPHVFKAIYRTDKQLGEGAYSVVKLAFNKFTGAKSAVKIVNRTDISPEDDLALKQEVDIMRQLNHPNIINCYDFFEEEKNYYVVLEYMDGGELFDRIVKKTVYNEKEARDVVKILVSAIKYCHDRDVVHRDLKPENLLLTSREDDASLKIADFGFAVRVNSNLLSTQCGTPGYIAPEILENKPYGKAVDMWSIGVITYIILGGYPPFHDDNMRNLFRKIRKGDFEFHPEYWKNVSSDAKDLIKGLLTVNASARLTADQVLQHPWLMTDDATLAAINLDSNLAEFKKFNAARRFKGAAKAVMAVNRMRLLLNSHKGDESDIDSDLRNAERA